MTEFLLIVFVIVGLAIGFAVFSANEQAEAMKRRVESARQREAERTRLSELRLSFAESELSGWQHITPAKINGVPGFFSISTNGLLMRYIGCSHLDGTITKIDDKTLAINSVLSFDIVVTDRTKTITHVDKVPVAIKQKRSTVGRAVLGGALLGPAGAVVGGLSGLNGKNNVEYRNISRTEVINVKGPSRLILGLSDLTTPVLQIEFELSSRSTEWWYRIQSAKSGHQPH